VNIFFHIPHPFLASTHRLLFPAARHALLSETNPSSGNGGIEYMHPVLFLVLFLQFQLGVLFKIFYYPFVLCTKVASVRNLHCVARVLQPVCVSVSA
jgi:hypothetical protein